MDPITQGALGACAAQLCLPLDKKQIHRIWIAGALGGMAADLDIFIRSASNPMLSLLYHRHFTHSLSFIPIGGFIVALFLWIMPSFRNHWRIILYASLLGYATHGLLDACTSYGTVLYWPFSLRRIHWDILPIIDPFITYPLVIGLTAGIIFKNKLNIAYGMLLALSVLCIYSWQHQRVLHFVENMVPLRSQQHEKLRVIPVALNPMMWRGLILHKHSIQILDIKAHILSSIQLLNTRSYPLFTEQSLPEWVRQSASLMQDFEIFRWFTDGYLVLASSDPLTLADGRYIIQSNPPRSLWGIEFNPTQPRVTKMSFIKVSPTP